MPEDNRFAGLSEAVDDDSDDDPDSVPNSETGSAADDSSDQSNPTPETEAESDASDGASDTETETDTGTETGADDAASDGTADTDSGADAEDPTAFPFDATEKKTVYVRPETLDRLEDARALVDAQLRTDHDVRDLTGREFYDAAFRLAASDTDGLIEQLLEAREESDD